MTLRYWGTIPGGFPSPAQGYEDEPLDLHALLVRRPAATFFYAVKGDSLRAEGIRDGSILVVDSRSQLKENSIFRCRPTQ